MVGGSFKIVFLFIRGNIYCIEGGDAWIKETGQKVGCIQCRVRCKSKRVNALVLLLRLGMVSHCLSDDASLVPGEDAVPLLLIQCMGYVRMP